MLKLTSMFLEQPAWLAVTEFLSKMYKHGPSYSSRLNAWHKLSWWFVINIDLASLDCVKVGSVPSVLVVHATYFDPEDIGTMYHQNVDNTARFRVV
jgi:hypothetical protein